MAHDISEVKTRLANVRNAERLVDDLDALVYVGIIREFPGADTFEVNERLVAEAPTQCPNERSALRSDD